jgi:cellulose biosynthesis protein BcsQ
MLNKAKKDEITLEELGQYYGKGTSTMSDLRKSNVSMYNALLREYQNFLELSTLVDRPIVIMFIGFKGGVGKTSMSVILNEALHPGKSTILELDIGERIKECTSLDAIDFTELLEINPDLTIEEAISLYKEEANFIILDTPGEISGLMVSAMQYVDLFIFPTGIDSKEEQRLELTLETTLLDESLGCYPIDKELNIMFLFNKYYEDKELALFETHKMEKLEPIIEELETVYPSVNVGYSKFKHSKIIPNMSRSKKSVAKLSMEQKVQYRMAKKWSKEFADDVIEMIKKIK